MNPSEVIGRLLAYESRIDITSPPKKQKRIALKTSKHEKEDSDSDDDMILMMKNFKRFLKLEKGDITL